MRVRDIALASVLAPLYAVLVLALAGISFQMVQIRVADALIPLSMVFGWPVVFGVTVGCVVANIASPMPSLVVDITFGAIANFLASVLAWKVSDLEIGSKAVSEFLGCLVAAATVTFVVGTYLAILTQMELWLWWLGIGVGSIISIDVLGYTLVQVLKKVSKSTIT